MLPALHCRGSQLRPRCRLRIWVHREPADSFVLKAHLANTIVPQDERVGNCHGKDKR